MRPIRMVVLVAGAILALSLGAPTVMAAEDPQPVHMVKDCSTFAGTIPSLCTIRSSTLGEIGIETEVWYNGPVLTNQAFLSSKVLLDAHNGDTATGYCMFDYSKSTGFSDKPIGMCTFWGGTGRLAGFNAVVGVTIDDTDLWHWDGTYRFSDATDPPAIGDAETVHLTRDSRRHL